MEVAGDRSPLRRSPLTAHLCQTNLSIAECHLSSPLASPAPCLCFLFASLPGSPHPTAPSPTPQALKRFIGKRNVKGLRLDSVDSVASAMLYLEKTKEYLWYAYRYPAQSEPAR